MSANPWSRPTLPVLLSLNGGYVDTAGFLALNGLFTAHVTGNFVTLGASLALGASGAIVKLLALPTFCLVVLVTRLASHVVSDARLPLLNTIIAFKIVLLGIGAALAIHFGPFKAGDDGAEIATGLTFVSAMAIQNAAHRIYLSSAPPTTLMTGTTTQIMIDLADIIRRPAPELGPAARSRLQSMSANLAAFAFGCGLAALAFAIAGAWCFLLPPLIATASLAVAEPDGGGR
jgi:uncharacterized membrane protein YoaK (UPF0700 family)